MNAYQIIYKYPHRIPQHVVDVEADLIKAIRKELGDHPLKMVNSEDNPVPSWVEPIVNMLETLQGSPTQEHVEFMRTLYWMSRGARRLIKVDHAVVKRMLISFSSWLEDIEHHLSIDLFGFRNPGLGRVNAQYFQTFVDYCTIYADVTHRNIDGLIYVEKLMRHTFEYDDDRVVFGTLAMLKNSLSWNPFFNGGQVATTQGEVLNFDAIESVIPATNLEHKV